MRLPKHKLPKEASKHTRQHKHSQKKIVKLERRLEKAGKKSEMDVDDDDVEDGGEGMVEEVVDSRTEEEKDAARLERKRANAPKVFYKKVNKSLSGKNGPRAVTK